MQYCNALLLKVTFPNTGDNVNKEEEKLTGVIECTHTELTWSDSRTNDSYELIAWRFESDSVSESFRAAMSYLGHVGFGMTRIQM